MAQTKIGWRPYVATTTTTASTLLTSLYSVWNADTLGTSLDSSIYGAWNGENNANDSVSTNHGTLVNGTTFTAGKIGQAFTFNGSNYVTMGTNVANFGSNSFSISGWFYPNVGNVLQVLVAKGTTTATNKGFYVVIDNRYNSNQRGLGFGLVGNNSNYQNITTTTANQYNIGGWNHFTAIWDSVNKTMKIYLNGVQGTTTTTLSGGTGASGISDISNTSAELLFGKYGDNTLYFNGKIDAVTIWTKILSQDEVTQLYNLGTGTQYPFSGQTLPSFNNQFAIDNGTSPSGSVPTFTDGKIGKAFTFDGINDYIALPDNSINVTGDFSISGWVYIPSGYVGGNQIYILNNISANTWYNNPNGYALSTYGNWIYFDLCNNTNTNLTLTYNYGPGFPTNTWYHIVATRKSGVGSKIYLNGSLVASNTNTVNHTHLATVSKPCIGALNIPGRGSVGYFPPANTRIDAVSLWNKELTQSEVTELYNSGNGKQLTVATPIVTNGLVLNLDASRTSSYPNSGTTWTDISGNGNNGTMVNGPIFGTANGGQITFDGIDDYVNLGDVLDMGTKSYTINMWIKLNSISTIYQTFLSKALAGQQNYRFAVGINNYNKLYAFLQGNTFGADVTPTGTISLPLNTWFMATYVINRSSSISMYYNGVNDALSSNGTISQWNGLDFQSNNPFRIGSYTGADNSTPISMTSGAIATTQVYDRVLSSTEITQNYNATKSRFGL